MDKKPKWPKNPGKMFLRIVKSIEEGLKKMQGGEYQPTNREKVRKPKRGKFWCYGCDMCLVGEREKCPVCGTRNNRKRDKK